MKFNSYGKLLTLGLMLALTGAQTTSAQDAALQLSKHADFSTNDREFEEGDVVYVRVTAPEVDATDLETNELRLSTANADGVASFVWNLALENNLNGTYTAVLDSLGMGTWYLRAVVADSKGAAFEGDATFMIGRHSISPEFRVEGTISELGDQFLVIENRRIFVNPNTKVFNESGEPIEFSGLRIGDRVVVEFTVSFSGELIARSIHRRNHDDHGVELRGRISEIGDKNFVILDRVVLVDSATVIYDEYEQMIRFEQLAVGDIVQLKGVELASGQVLARKIQREDSHDDEVEFTGVIQEIGERRLLVMGRNVIVVDETEIIGKDGQEISFGDLSVGMFVHVRATVGLTDVNSMVAKRIKVIEDNRFIVEGEIEELGERRLVVEGIPFLVVEDTEIMTSTGVYLRFSDLAVGFKVTVFGTAINSTNNLVALKIIVHRPSVEVRTITGFITRIDGQLIVVGDHVISVVDGTEILDEHGEKIPFSDLEVGLRVRVVAVAFANATDLATSRILVAKKIQVLPEREKRVVGRIREVSETSIVVASVRAQITDETVILNRQGEPIGVDDLTVGALAAMHVVETASGIVATRIRLLPRLEDEVGVAGVLEAVEDSAVVVLGQTFQILPNTVARDENGDRIPYDDLEVGRPVALRGELLAGGTLVALHIQELSHNVRGIKVLGPVESVGQTTIEVIGIHFFVDADTKMYDLNRQEIGLSDIEVGQTVLVNAEGQANGTRLAKTVQLLDVTISAGDLRLDAGGTLSVLGVDYAVAPDVLIVTSDDVSIDGGGLTDGMFVEIRGSRIDETGYTVTKVKILSAQSVGVEDSVPGEVPVAVRLGANYPNPFSTSTTIAFDLSEGSAGARTTLTVYDLTGRHVRTLVDATLTPGGYTAAWDGRDEAGRHVASGLYFYRVRSGDSSTARTMMLVK